MKMGSLISYCFHNNENKYRVDEPETTEEPKVYSWDKKRLDPSQYIFDKLEDQVLGKLPGSINGQQFIIQNCKRCHIYLFDVSASINIDDCDDCKILIGPCRGSIFIRDSTNCNVAVACQQLRTRDCKNIVLFLHCATQPVIEESSMMHFACLQWDFEGLEDLYKSANLSIFNNLWSKIHDFSSVAGRMNYSYLPEDAKLENYVPIKEVEGQKWPEVSSDKSLVPLTLGQRKLPHTEWCFALVFSDSDCSSAEWSHKLLTRALEAKLCLVAAKEAQMLPMDLERITKCKLYNDFAEKGSIISLEFCGFGAIKIVPELVGNLNMTGQVLVPAEGKEAAELRHNFHSYFDMKMGL